MSENNSNQTKNTVIFLSHVIKLFATDGKNYKAALNDISLSIEKGSVTIVAGPNGSGKSVLMGIISGLEKATDGQVQVASKPGLIFQDASTQILGDTPLEDAAVGPRNQGFSKKESEQKAEEALKKVSLEEKILYPAEFLSGGEKRRLAVASILSMERDILIFDEPYANLDYPSVKDVNKLICDLHNDGKTVIILTHELEKCLALADHFIILRKGKIVFDGKAEEALKLPLESWGIRNPLAKYESISDLLWA